MLSHVNNCVGWWPEIPKRGAKEAMIPPSSHKKAICAEASYAWIVCLSTPENWNHCANGFIGLLRRLSGEPIVTQKRRRSLKMKCLPALEIKTLLVSRRPTIFDQTGNSSRHSILKM
jgi:hypothetical protein